MSSLIIEVCVDSVESAMAAIRGGANRLELCGNLGLGGGTTPSMGAFKAVRRVAQKASIMVMIRPRTGDFLYTPFEMDIMLEDIRAFKHAGADGFVFGVLTNQGRVDLDRTFILVAQAAPQEVCFHRAFDMTRDPMEGEYCLSSYIHRVHGVGVADDIDNTTALRDLKSIPGITRVLTSGHGIHAPSSLAVLQKLLREAKRTLTILPGAGINPDTVTPLLEGLSPYGCREVHLSGGEWQPSEMAFRRDGMGMGMGGDGEWGIWRTKEEAVRAVRQIADAFQEARREQRAAAKSSQ